MYCDWCACVNIKPLHWKKDFLCSSKQNRTKEWVYANCIWFLGLLMFILVWIPSAVEEGYICNSAGNEIFLRAICFTLNRCCSRKVRELWWQGIPPSVRGKVWSLAIGNELNITHGEAAVLSTVFIKWNGKGTFLYLLWCGCEEMLSSYAFLMLLWCVLFKNTASFNLGAVLGLLL